MAENVKADGGRLTFRMNKKAWKPEPGQLANDRPFMFHRPCRSSEDDTLCEGCDDD